MTSFLASAAMPVFRRLDPERAHGLALLALRRGLGGAAPAPDPRLAVCALGLRFAHPIGLAAGFDKDGVALVPLLRLGFGFVEAGTVTPRPQPGNPRPRLFRLTEDHAAINRFGFNNRGVAALLPRLARARGGAGGAQGPIGANVGINKDSADPVGDYPALVAAVAAHADYVVVNVSSPNTPGLRDLQGPARLAAILGAIAARVPQRPPLLVKLSPDLATADLPAIVETCVAGGAQGLIVCNTTTARPPALRSAAAGQTGGLSGAPLFEPSTAMLAVVARLAAGRLVLIGTGGIFSGEDVLAKLRAGAHLVQLYTAFAEQGPALLPRLRRELLAALDRSGFARLEDAIGTGL